MHLSPDYMLLLMFVLGFTILLVFGKLPSADSFERVIHALNSRGGNILILSLFTLLSFEGALRLIYFILTHNVAETNPAISIGVSFVTGTAFGGFSSTLYKAMTGEQSSSRATDKNGGSTNDVPQETRPNTP